LNNDRSFLGHPRGLAYLAFSEAWERFSYYSMQALLVLYMARQLLLPGHVEHIAGFNGFRARIAAWSTWRRSSVVWWRIGSSAERAPSSSGRC
jgi:hypothetical protein